MVLLQSIYGTDTRPAAMQHIAVQFFVALRLILLLSHHSKPASFPYCKIFVTLRLVVYR